ncbi:MAG: Re/Si-specific NAD(P)(+) transhydrogenase subunit alpha [Thermoflavifilum sp.]|uniref:Re/Si-specific NAD(P)(+) transhydrogenase subunit alpha n=1 Tax=Thermoflavifilum sp. TaxID=1968839 RepID=UPI0018A57410|nr:Re/Si-specific NAD(P)(+) transhydrogenase subunit alpha [Thermoflavifilum sp.]QOR75657.1 MAG: Re/Si-specific NAD(P)(+) transhydrogenase subunit alpha [Thermoflavifilum sp.]
MIIGICKEPEGENRVSCLPDVARQLIQLKQEVWIASGAGERAYAADADYEALGVHVADQQEVLQRADVLCRMHFPEDDDLIARAREKSIWIGMYQPLYHRAEMQKMASHGMTVCSLDAIPRTTRAQSMDVLSSQANIAGYKAVILAAAHYPHYFPMLMTAAGSIQPARVLVLGAGVAGLQAIATARRLGAVVEAFDTRPAVKEEVMSLGAKFIEVEGAADPAAAGGYAVEQSAEYQRRQKEKIAATITRADIVITTAQIPGKRAPLLVTREMVETMRAGSVIVDLAASTGGNTELTRDGETIVHRGVTIIGHSNLPSTVPADASKLYGRNLLHFLQLLINKEGNLQFNFEDDIISAACVVYEGQIRDARILQAQPQA